MAGKLKYPEAMQAQAERAEQQAANRNALLESKALMLQARDEQHRVLNSATQRLHTWSTIVAAVIQRPDVHLNDVPKRTEELMHEWDAYNFHVLRHNTELGRIYTELDKIDEELREIL